MEEKDQARARVLDTLKASKRLLKFSELLAKSNVKRAAAKEILVDLVASKEVIRHGAGPSTAYGMPGIERGDGVAAAPKVSAPKKASKKKASRKKRKAPRRAPARQARSQATANGVPTAWFDGAGQILLMHPDGRSKTLTQEEARAIAYLVVSFKEKSLLPGTAP